MAVFVVFNGIHCYKGWEANKESVCVINAKVAEQRILGRWFRLELGPKRTFQERETDYLILLTRPMCEVHDDERTRCLQLGQGCPC